MGHKRTPLSLRSGLNGARRSPMSAHPHHVVIAGGGVAGMEAMLALHELAGHRVQVTIVSRQRQFLYRPVTVAEAFDRGEARTYALAEMVQDAGAALIWDK